MTNVGAGCNLNCSFRYFEVLKMVAVDIAFMKNVVSALLIMCIVMTRYYNISFCDGFVRII